MGEVSSFVQSDIEGYVHIPKPNMEEKLIGMIEKLTIKVIILVNPGQVPTKPHCHRHISVRQ